jgi:hypothetical protein
MIWVVIPMMMMMMMGMLLMMLVLFVVDIVGCVLLNVIHTRGGDKHCCASRRDRGRLRKRMQNGLFVRFHLVKASLFVRPFSLAMAHPRRWASRAKIRFELCMHDSMRCGWLWMDRHSCCWSKRLGSLTSLVRYMMFQCLWVHTILRVENHSVDST